MATLRQSQALATRQRLVEVAAELFAADGFARVTTKSLSEAAGMTRGALYHHFANMTEVMEAVFKRAEGVLVAEVGRALAAVEAPGQRFLAIGPATLEVLGREPSLQRIVFVEAPAALGWTRWRALDGGRSLGLIQDLLQDLERAGELVHGVEPRIAAQLVLGAINECGMYAASVSDARRSQAAQQLSLLCGGLLRPAR